MSDDRIDALGKAYQTTTSNVTGMSSGPDIQTYHGEVKTVIPNRYVACKPYQPQESKGGVFSSWELKNPLVELEIVFGDKEGEFLPGSNIYVRPFLDAPGWAKEIFTFGGREVVLVPKEVIVGYKFLDQKAPSFAKFTNPPGWDHVNRYGVLGSSTGSGTGYDPGGLLSQVSSSTTSLPFMKLSTF